MTNDKANQFPPSVSSQTAKGCPKGCL